MYIQGIPDYLCGSFFNSSMRITQKNVKKNSFFLTCLHVRNCRLASAKCKSDMMYMPITPCVQIFLCQTTTLDANMKAFSHFPHIVIVFRIANFQ